MNIHDEITIPGQEARHGEVPAWVADSPVWPAVKTQTGGGQLFLHQATGLELLGYGHNLVISTGTASGKSLVFQALIGDAVAAVVASAREAGKPLVIEDLDFSKMRDLLEGESPGRSRMLSSFAYGRIKTYFLSRGYREGVEVREVNPAYSSVIGRVTFMERILIR